jgi:ABC-type multidrug transport system fused ATPase/permease subunit
MEKTNPEKTYKERIASTASQIHQFRRKETFLSAFKLLCVVAGILLLIKLATRFTLIPLLGFLVVLILFVFAVAVHENIIKKRKFEETLKGINENEIKALLGEFLDFDAGEEFLSVDHEYSSDLDIFGRRSVFHFLNRATTSIGKRFLSDWLKTFPQDSRINEIEEKQDAVRELAGKLDLRQNIQAHGKFIEDSMKRLESFQGLFDEPDAVLGKKPLIVFIHVFPLITLGAVVSLFFHVSWLVPAACVFIQGTVNRMTGKARQRIYLHSSRNAKILTAYSRITAELERESFTSGKLKDYRSELFLDDRPASYHIKRLSTLLGYFDLRQSREFHLLFNNLVFWDLHCVYRIEKWKRRAAPVVHKWFDVIGRFEALSSLANTLFNNPDWTIPEVCGPDFRLEARSIGHPLIPRAENVRNDISLNHKGNILIVTGPNMSGKTTFLKTLGVNIVLAMAGGPVCAQRFVLSPLRLCTSMKVTDSLDKKLSLFYAELQRLKMIMDAILGKDPVFFLIDEMLKGTNESDRHKGAIALIRQLVENKADGILATHDLELTKLEEEFPAAISNYHFDGYIEEDRLLFDYKLKAGICQSSNALELMKKVGIKV